jgi:hypothetical protein
MIKRFALGVMTSLVLSASALAADIVVYKSEGCGCCKKWVEHLRENGFSVKTNDVEDVTPYKQANHVPSELASCHTAVVDGYVIEGHVPASDIQRLLKQRPKIAGLAVPGMPLGSPGMEADTAQPYEVMSFDKTGKAKVYAKH